MTTLTEFLLARLAEDEAMATEAARDPRAWVGLDEGVCDEQGSHVGYSPARVLAEVEAKRRIVGLHSGENFPTTRPGLHLCEDSMIPPEACETMRALASVYSDHPAFNPSWRA